MNKHFFDYIIIDETNVDLIAGMFKNSGSGNSEVGLLFESGAKKFTSYSVAGEKFKFLPCGRYVVVLLKDHTNASSNFFKISIFSLKGLKH